MGTAADLDIELDFALERKASGVGIFRPLTDAAREYLKDSNLEEFLAANGSLETSRDFIEANVDLIEEAGLIIG